MPRNKTQLIVSLLLGAAVCFLPPALTAAQEDAGGEKRLSQPIQKAEAKTLQDISRRLEEIQENLPELLVQAREKIQGLSPRLNQLLRLKAFVGKDFRKISLIRHALQNLQKQLANSLEPIQSLDRELEDLRSSLETSKESLLEQLKFPVAWNENKTKLLYRYDELDRQLRDLQGRIDEVKELSEPFSKHIASLQEQTQQEMTTAWVDYFFEPAPSILKSNLQQWKQEYMVWQQGLPVYLNFFLLGQTAWIPFLSHLVLYAAAIFLLLFGTIRFLRSKIPIIQTAPCLSSLVMICLALGIWFASTLHQSTYQSMFFSTLAQLLVMRGLVQLYQQIRNTIQPDESPQSRLLVVLWYAFAAALILQTLDFPPLPMQGLWVFLLVIVVLFIRRQKTRPGLNLEKILHNLSMFILTGLGVLSVLGWINLSLLMTAFWFVLALALQYGSLAGHLLKRRIASMPETKLGYLRRGITQGTGIPIIWIASILLAALWLEVNLGDFQLMEKLSDLKIGWGKLSINFFRLLFVLISFYVVRSGLIILRTLIESIAEVNEQLDPGTTATLNTLLTYLVWGVFLMISLAFVGVNLTSLTVVAGGLSVGIGFGMQSIVNNFISGLILLFGRSIKPGDIIQLGDLWATVKEVNIRTTEVITFDQSNVFVPNSQLIGDQITNWTHQNKTIRRKIVVGVAYGSDIDLVKRLLLYLAETNPNVYKIPAPFCRFINFGSSSLDFCLYIYASIDTAWETESELRFDIDTVFREYKVEIAFPQQDVHLKWGDGLEKLLERFKTEQAVTDEKA